jgi:DNA primase
LIEHAGAETLRERVDASVPFVAFHVDRILERNDTRSAEGRERAFHELQPALEHLQGGPFGDDLLRRVAGRLDLRPDRLEALIKAATPSIPSVKVGMPSAASGNQLVDTALRAERAFLTLCIALPEAGARMLYEIDTDALITSEVMRRAARHIAGRTQSPLADLPHDDEPLARTVADLVSRAGRSRQVSEDELEHARLLLERDRLDRAIRRTRADGGAGVELATERQAVLARIHAVTTRLQRAM